MTEQTEKKPDDKHREAQQKVIEEKRFDFIEKSKPEDRIDGDLDVRAGRGQLTRDNVNPAIPSAKPGEGDIVDPKRLGMESQAGAAPPKREEPRPVAKSDEPASQILSEDTPASINEPPGSHVQVLVEAEPQPAKIAAKPATATSGADPDELEDEIEAAEDDDDVDVKHGGKKGKKK